MTYNGLTLGDGSNFYIENLDVGELEIREASQLAAGRDGGFIFNQNYGFREISFDVNIFSGTAEQLFIDIRNLRQAFSRTNDGREFVINYWDATTRKILAFPSITPNPIHRSGASTRASFSVTLKCPFPFFYDAGIINETLELDESLGFDYPFDYPFDYVAGTTTSEYIFDNDGDAPAIIGARFNGSVINPTLTNTSQGSFIQIEDTLSSSQYVDLSYTSRGRVIVDQDGASAESRFNGETSFFSVPIGSNTFAFTASTYDELASCDITLTKYYLS